jgi:DNA-binding NtrC family response regulator
MAKAKILVIDHDNDWARLLSELLLRENYDVLTSRTPAEALKLLEASRFDLIVADINPPGTDGNGFLDQLRRLFPQVPLLVHTDRGSVGQAVLATRLGVVDYWEKEEGTSNIEALRAKIAETIYQRVERPATRPIRQTPGGAAPLAEGFCGIISQNAQMRDIFELIQTIADSYANVLIHGETGTGKDLVAHAIHDSGDRHSRPFVTVDCSILARELLESELFGHEKGAFTGATARHIGRFERANNGTLFLDEVANIPAPVQAKLLRVLQTRTFERVGGHTPISVNVRIIAATNQPLERGVTDGSFREDLYHRLNVVQIDLPALRERVEDVPLLAGEFLRRYARQNGRDVRGFTDAAVHALTSYRWPGNIRELENVVLQAVVLAKSPFIDLGDLPRRITDGAGGPLPATLAEQLGQPEKQILLNALREHAGNIKQTAAALHVSRTTLYAKMKKYDIEPDTTR